MSKGRKGQKVKSESDIHYSLRLFALAELNGKGVSAELEYQPFPKFSKHRLDIAIPEAKLGLEIYSSPCIANRNDIILRRRRLQELGWVIEFFIFPMHLKKINQIIDKIIWWHKIRTGIKEYTTVCSNEKSQTVITQWRGNEITGVRLIE